MQRNTIKPEPIETETLSGEGLGKPIVEDKKPAQTKKGTKRKRDEDYDRDYDPDDVDEDYQPEYDPENKPQNIAFKNNNSLPGHLAYAQLLPNYPEILFVFKTPSAKFASSLRGNIGIRQGLNKSPISFRAGEESPYLFVVSGINPIRAGKEYIDGHIATISQVITKLASNYNLKSVESVVNRISKASEQDTKEIIKYFKRIIGPITKKLSLDDEHKTDYTDQIKEMVLPKNNTYAKLSTQYSSLRSFSDPELDFRYAFVGLDGKRAEYLKSNLNNKRLNIKENGISLMHCRKDGINDYVIPVNSFESELKKLTKDEIAEKFIEALAFRTGEKAEKIKKTIVPASVAEIAAIKTSVSKDAKKKKGLTEQESGEYHKLKRLPRKRAKLEGSNQSATLSLSSQSINAASVGAGAVSSSGAGSGAASSAGSGAASSSALSASSHAAIQAQLSLRTQPDGASHVRVKLEESSDSDEDMPISQLGALADGTGSFSFEDNLQLPSLEHLGLLSASPSQSLFSLPTVGEGELFTDEDSFVIEVSSELEHMQSIQTPTIGAGVKTEFPKVDSEGDIEMSGRSQLVL